MRALTLWQPWHLAILANAADAQPVAPKLVENRTWAPPQSVLGQRIALHVGRHYDEDGAAFIRGLCPDLTLTREPGGRIAGTAVVAEACRFDDLVRPAWARGSWAFGPWVWRLADVETWPGDSPILRGAMGLWDLP